MKTLFTRLAGGLMLRLYGLYMQMAKKTRDYRRWAEDNNTCIS